MAFESGSFTDGAKPLPVFLLLDISGSMYGDKIVALNTAVRKMIDEFKNTVAKEVELQLCVIKFSGNASIHLPLQSVENIIWSDLDADGGTRLDEALNLAKKLIEDRNVVPSRAYRPAVILVSDGLPFPGWEKPMQDFINNGRTSKCDRMSMLIGDKSAVDVMNQFLVGSGNRLFFANDAKDVGKFFKYVTMTTQQRTLSQTPNTTIAMPSYDPANTVVDSQPVPNYSGPATTVVIDSDDEDDDE